MDIILNEREYAEKIIATGIIPKPEVDTLYILAKYYRENGVENNELEAKLNEFMNTNYKNYNEVSWSKTLGYVMSKSKRHKIIDIDYMPVTKNELKTIGELEDKEYQQLAFTILCIAKFYNKINPQNNDWVNQDFKYIFESAGIIKSGEIQAVMFHELRNKGLVRFSRVPENTNINVLFIDNDSDEALKVTDFRRLGYEYLNYTGEKFIRCINCNLIMRAKTQKKRCRKCQEDYRRECKRNFMRNKRYTI